MTADPLASALRNIHYYGLLHINRRETTAMNLGGSDFDQKLSIYKRNAITLARSLAAAGLPFTLLTNSRQALSELPDSVPCLEIPFSLELPSGTGFYSAHYKIDVLRHFATARDGYHILCDLDVICINPLPRSLLTLVARGTPLCYDVSDQVIPAHGRDVIIDDLSRLGGLPSEGRWYGGELIGGTPDFFRRLCVQIDQVLPRYLASIRSLHHTSDEAIVTPALELLKLQNVTIADAGTIGLISRFWSTEVAHPQRPLAWSAACFLLHLPYDKQLLAEASGWSDQHLRQFPTHYQAVLKARSSVTRRIRAKVRSLLRPLGRLFLRQSPPA